MTRAAYYVGDGAIELQDCPVTPPGPGEVQIAVAFTGICSTDLRVLRGHMDRRMSLPRVVAHEMSGVIARVGDGVTRLAPGDPVTVMPLRWCYECPACAAGNQHLCQESAFVGIDSPGSMQPRWNVPHEIVIPIPPELRLRHAVLVEPTAVAVHDVRRAAVTGGERVVVIGGGPVGLLIAVVARDVGADAVIVETDRHRRAIAARAGFATLDPAVEYLVDRVDDWSHGAAAEVVFETSASASGLDAAVEMLGVRGRLVVVGLHTERRRVDLHRVLRRELEILGARMYERTDFQQAIALVTEGVIPAELLISAVVPLSRAADAFSRLAAGSDVMKVLVDCQEIGA